PPPGPGGGRRPGSGSRWKRSSGGCARAAGAGPPARTSDAAGPGTGRGAAGRPGRRSSRPAGPWRDVLVRQSARFPQRLQGLPAPPGFPLGLVLVLVFLLLLFLLGLGDDLRLGLLALLLALAAAALDRVLQEPTGQHHADAGPVEPAGLRAAPGDGVQSTKPVEQA